MLSALCKIASAFGWLTVILLLSSMLGIGNFVYYFGFGDVIIIKCDDCTAAQASDTAVPL